MWLVLGLPGGSAKFVYTSERRNRVSSLQNSSSFLRGFPLSAPTGSQFGRDPVKCNLQCLSPSTAEQSLEWLAWVWKTLIKNWDHISFLHGWLIQKTFSSALCTFLSKGQRNGESRTERRDSSRAVYIFTTWCDEDCLSLFWIKCIGAGAILSCLEFHSRK